jgi:hypothetical protein
MKYIEIVALKTEKFANYLGNVGSDLAFAAQCTKVQSGPVINIVRSSSNVSKVCISGIGTEYLEGL